MIPIISFASFFSFFFFKVNYSKPPHFTEFHFLKVSVTALHFLVCITPAGILNLRMLWCLLHNNSSPIRFSIWFWALSGSKQVFHFLLWLSSQVFYKIITDGIYKSHGCCSLYVTFIQTTGRGRGPKCHIPVILTALVGAQSVLPSW